VRDCGTAHQERPLQVDVDDEVPGFLRHVPEQTPIGTVGGGGIVDEHIDATESRERVRDEALGVGCAAHVSHQREDAAPQILDLPGQALETLPAETDFREPLLVLVSRAAAGHVRRDDIGTRACERDAHGPAHPLRSRTSCDQHDLAVEFAHRRNLLARGRRGT
jgi:hypothetical protein